MINSSSFKDLLHDKRRLTIDIGILILVLFIVVFAFKACTDDGKDLGDGFKETNASKTKTTKPSSKPNLDQPCSMLKKSEATALLGSEVETGTNEDTDKNTLRCRFDAVTSDGKFFLNINVYVFKNKDAYNTLKISNNGIKIETNVDDGFYAVREKSLEVERIVAVADGNKRIAVSASVASINPGAKITLAEQTFIPDGATLATYAGKIMAKL